MTFTAHGDVAKLHRSTFSRDRLSKLDANEDTAALRVLGAPSGPLTEIGLHLRDHPGFERATTDRHAILYSGTHHGLAEPGILEFMRVASDAYPIVHGGAALLPTRWHASAEASLVGHSEIDSETEKRKHFDAMHVHEALQLARRLYPVTIFGPELWAKLPPLPDVDPVPKVEDLGNCKMLTCWPELVSPHDQDFLLGTRALRRWLWPFTIKNPADEPDEIDSKLRWAGKLPW